MSDIAIQVEHLSKMYRLGVINNGTLWKDLQTWIALKRGKDDPHSKIGEDKYSGDKDHFWALKDVSFQIHEGDRIGIIGRNGAGKSTLLKLLSRVTSPTEGVIKIHGKISSLLEVGTGFHGELTGRENIYLNGAILGMKKRQIDKKLDEIIDFCEIDHHIDTPVKRYSSGMYVRLAFAVAAHLDSDILIADEVLAVGDANFQKKALGKMNDLSTGQGRTVLFVSHNMNAVEGLCNKGIILQNGRVVDTDNNIHKIISRYLYPNKDGTKNLICENIDSTDKHANFSLIRMYCVKNSDVVTNEILRTDTNVFVIIEAEIADLNSLLNVGLFIKTQDNLVLFSTWLKDRLSGQAIKQGFNVFSIPIPVGFFNIGRYKFELYAGLHHVAEIIPFGKYYLEIDVSGSINTEFGDGAREGQIAPVISWEIRQ